MTRWQRIKIAGHIHLSHIEEVSLTEKDTSKVGTFSEIENCYVSTFALHFGLMSFPDLPETWLLNEKYTPFIESWIQNWHITYAVPST